MLLISYLGVAEDITGTVNSNCFMHEARLKSNVHLKDPLFDRPSIISSRRQSPGTALILFYVIGPGGGGGGHSQTEVVPMLVRAPQNWTLNGVIPVSKSTLNGVEKCKIYP